MRVDFYGIFRPIVGVKSIEVENDLNLRQVLAHIVARYPALRAELLDEQGRLYPWIPLYVNGRNPRLWADGLERPIGAAEVYAFVFKGFSFRTEPYPFAVLRCRGLRRVISRTYRELRPRCGKARSSLISARLAWL